MSTNPSSEERLMASHLPCSLWSFLDRASLWEFYLAHPKRKSCLCLQTGLASCCIPTGWHDPDDGYVVLWGIFYALTWIPFVITLNCWMGLPHLSSGLG